AGADRRALHPAALRGHVEAGRGRWHHKAGKRLALHSKLSLFAAAAQDEEVQSPADEATGADRAAELFLPALRFGFADRADLGCRLAGALGKIGVEAARLALERHERLHFHLLDAEAREQAGQLTHELAVDGRVIAGGGDHPPRHIAIRMRDEEAVAVEVENADAAADARDSYHVLDRRYGVGYVSEHRRSEARIEARVAEGQRAAIAR